MQSLRPPVAEIGRNDLLFFAFSAICINIIIKWKYRHLEEKWREGALFLSCASSNRPCYLLISLLCLHALHAQTNPICLSRAKLYSSFLCFAVTHGCCHRIIAASDWNFLPLWDCKIQLWWCDHIIMSLWYVTNSLRGGFVIFTIPLSTNFCNRQLLISTLQAFKGTEISKKFAVNNKSAFMHWSSFSSVGQCTNSSMLKDIMLEKNPSTKNKAKQPPDGKTTSPQFLFWPGLRVPGCSVKQSSENRERERWCNEWVIY